MAKGEETDEHCRACVEKDALIATLKAGVAALKTTQGAMRAAMAAMEKRWCQWAELPRELLGMVLENLQEAPLCGWGRRLQRRAPGEQRVEGKPRCDGDTAGDVLGDERRGHVAAGAALPRGEEPGDGKGTFSIRAT
jgi:hypothetical protein